MAIITTWSDFAHGHTHARRSSEALLRDEGARDPGFMPRMTDGFDQGWMSFEGEIRKGSTDGAAVLADLVARG